MEGPDPFEISVRAGLKRIGLVPDEIDLAVMRATESIYGPQIDALMTVDLEHVADEPEIDLSLPPDPA
jgi:hypothetical protein